MLHIGLASKVEPPGIMTGAVYKSCHRRLTDAASVLGISSQSPREGKPEPARETRANRALSLVRPDLRERTIARELVWLAAAAAEADCY